MSENLLRNLSIKNSSTSDYRNEASTSCTMQESLQLQHSTNLNIQRSQSAQRFGNSFMANGDNILNPPDEELYVAKRDPIEPRDDISTFSNEDINYFTNWGWLSFFFVSYINTTNSCFFFCVIRNQ